MNIKDLSPNQWNPRKISDTKLAMLKKSLDKFGDLSGFVFNRRTNKLISGHQRQKALLNGSIKIEKKYDPPTRCKTVAEGNALIDGERFKYREVDADTTWETEAMLAANKQGGEWDTELLKITISEVPNINLELTGFDIPELEALNIPAPVFDPEKVEPEPEPKTNDTDPDEIPEVVEPKTKLGDLYKLGNHRLLCGDSTVKENVDRLMGGEKADMVFTDPPYGISIVNSACNSEGAKAMTGSIGQDGQNRILKPRQYRKIENDESPETAFDAIANFPECDWIIWGGNFFAHRLPQSTHWIVWNKNSIDDAGEGAFFSDAELAWTNNKRTSVVTYRHGWTGIFRNGPRNEELAKRVHPTQKPVGLFSSILDDYTKSSNVILDPFLGSGSTLIACEKTNRRCFGMEIDPHYCDVIVARWEKFTGQKAEMVKRIII